MLSSIFSQKSIFIWSSIGLTGVELYLIELKNIKFKPYNAKQESIAIINFYSYTTISTEKTAKFLCFFKSCKSRKTRSYKIIFRSYIFISKEKKRGQNASNIGFAPILNI